MRAYEFVTESRSNRQGDSAKGFIDDISDPMVMTFAFPNMPGNNAYRAYRFAMAMANHELASKDGPTSQFAVISAYTDGDEKIIRAAMKNSNEKALIVGNPRSEEPKSTNKSSPVAQPKHNRYGV